MDAHLMQTHLILEPFAVGMFRTLSTSHPIHKLLKENLKFLVAINTLGRKETVQYHKETCTIGSVVKVRLQIWRSSILIQFNLSFSVATALGSVDDEVMLDWPEDPDRSGRLGSQKSDRGSRL